MSLHFTIKEGIKDAMRAKDAVRLTVLRGLTTAFTNELVAKGQTPQAELSDDDALTVVLRTAKQRKDAIEQFRAAGREDLAQADEAELKIIEEFLPAQMSEEEIRQAVIAKKEELGIADKAKIGTLLGSVMKDLKGKADGSIVKKVAEELF